MRKFKSYAQRKANAAFWRGVRAGKKWSRRRR